jgi:hypothetical protein
VGRALPGLPDLTWYNIPNWGKYTKLPQNIPNDYKMAVKEVHKCPLNIPTSAIVRPSKIYPNCDFWSENKPSVTMVEKCLTIKLQLFKILCLYAINMAE